MSEETKNSKEKTQELNITNNLGNKPKDTLKAPLKEEIIAKQVNPKDLKVKIQLSIRRKDVNAGLPGDDVTSQNPKIGSSLKGKSPLSGLELEEERKYLPEIIGIAPVDVNWRREIRDYWNNISERVPHDKEGTNSRLPGRVLSFTVEFKTIKDAKMCKDAKTFEEKAFFTKKGEVIEGVADYVLWRYCLVYSKVANSKADIHKSGKIKFYLYSQETEAQKKYDTFELRTRARNLFDNILTEESKINALLRLFDKDPTDTFQFANIKEKHLELDSLLQKDPKRFIMGVTDKALEQKALIKEAVLLGVIHNPANTDSYYYGDDRQIILGNSLTDAVLFLRNKEERNVQILESIKSQVLYNN